MIEAQELLLAFMLDLAIGDPRWLPHPVTIIGAGIQKVELFMRTYVAPPLQAKWAGVLLVMFIVIPSAGITLFVVKALRWLQGHDSWGVLGTIALVYLISTTIAVRGLTDSARLVIESVKDGSIEGARQKLSMIVGRDTKSLSENEVLKATVETLAENLSDGVIAPVFYLVIGGLPLAMTYKAINTLDSMVGYKNDRYLHFGWAAARLDDLANYLPARITGILIVISVFVVCMAKDTLNSLPAAIRSFKTMLRDGRNHTSPNSGIPEASMAGALGIRLGGPSTYGGSLVEKPYIGEPATEDYLTAAIKAIPLVWVASVVGAVIAASLLSMRTRL
ncbi:MAG: adenosylcobinamide-phosphate synthase CbiB [Thermodesulfovibrionales bacterium]